MGWVMLIYSRVRDRPNVCHYTHSLYTLYSVWYEERKNGKNYCYGHVVMNKKGIGLKHMKMKKKKHFAPQHITTDNLPFFSFLFIIIEDGRVSIQNMKPFVWYRPIYWKQKIKIVKNRNKNHREYKRELSGRCPR